jgi:hypothetical protein
VIPQSQLGTFDRLKIYGQNQWESTLKRNGKKLNQNYLLGKETYHNVALYSSRILRISYRCWGCTA